MDAFAAGDAKGVFAAIVKVIEVGQDPRRFAEDLLRRLRDLIIVAAVPEALSSGLVDVSDDQAERLNAQASAMGPGELTRAAEVIAVGLPAGLAMLGLVGSVPPRITAPLNAAALDELAILIVASSVVAVAAYRLRFPGGILFGAMLTSAILHGSGVIHAVVPWWIANTAMVLMGAITG